MNASQVVSRLIAAFSILGCGSLRADVSLPAIFGDNMVLQQGATLPVWGTASPGEAVTVTVGGHSATTKADDRGDWKVSIEPLPVNHSAATMEVTGKNSLAFSNVLVGEVWLCSGQSNMEFGLSNAHNASVEIPKADIPELRLFILPRNPMFDPQRDVKSGNPKFPLESHWVVCTPKSVLGGGWGGFSAIGYFFGKEIHEKTGEPVGLIGSEFGHTSADAWTSLNALKADPALVSFVKSYQNAKDNSAKLAAAYPAAEADYQKNLTDWNTKYKADFDQAMADWNKARQDAQKNGTAVPPRPVVPAPLPIAPNDGTMGPGVSSGLFNGMINPLIPYALKGVIWYQGETGPVTDYDKVFQCLIQDWRTRWNEGDFPFLYVQLANWNGWSGVPPPREPVESSEFARVRDSQFRTLKLKNTGMAVAIDVGLPADIHPKDKADVAHRLALQARRIAYGETTLVSSGPLYDSMQVEGNKIQIKFKFADSGLKIGAHPVIRLGDVPEQPPTQLDWFAIAGDDKEWVNATAVIDGSTVVVSSDQVSSPVAVRYGWANNPDCHLYNMQGLPAAPFRTDNWEGTEIATKPAAAAGPAPAH